jgi:hypothetical protein
LAGAFVSPECRNRQGEGAGLGALLAWRITTMWFGLALVFRESGLKNKATRLLLDLVRETLQCLSILLWFENMS